MGMRIATGNPSQLGREFPPVSVEQDDPVAAAQAQDRTMTSHPLRQIDLGADGKPHGCKKPRDGRWKALHAAILSKADLGLDPLCNPLIPRKLRLFSARRCYNPRNKNSFWGNGLRGRPPAPIALVALPPGQEMGGSRLRRYRATLIAPSLHLLQVVAICLSGRTMIWKGSQK